ncbi:DNA methyltransferase [Actinomadura syzygii]|uniref:DNA methyltransferase n=1 Tax=Actinomadura syzygii TaxID=1427538 RepID=UPI0016529096|nr:DNA methyltransferase [Actinomadura syzygii]
MPIEVPLACIATGCQPGGTVLDMFAADATTGLAARRLDRSFIGVEQNPDLCRIAEQRLREDNRHGDGDA